MRMELPVWRWAAAGRTMPTHGVGATGIKQCVVATKQAVSICASDSCSDSVRASR
ncbi:MAG: hypothetical protein CM15mP84_09710 [Cellvibrionales bacterium]|nr:MAG: hypothetical protein CM15mP84_09710 [Cellvibrionales bacterium]